MTVVLFDQGARERISYELGGQPVDTGIPAPMDVYDGERLEVNVVAALATVEGTRLHTHDEIVAAAAQAALRGSGA